MMTEVNTTIVEGEYPSFPLPQFHPEFKSRPNKPSPPFKTLLEMCINLSFCGALPHDPASPVRAYKKALPKKQFLCQTLINLKKTLFLIKI
jgi:hypothetical protein